MGNAMTCMTVEFVDTNVLVYAHNRRDEGRHPVARNLLTRLTEDGTGAVSIQVLQEWVNVVARRMPELFGDRAHSRHRLRRLNPM